MGMGACEAAATPRHDVPETDQLPAMAEGISLVLSRWAALQMAVEKGWGGRDSHRKSRDLAAALLSWFDESKGRSLKPHVLLHHIDDLESMLDEFMVLSFNTEVEDGSIEEVAEQLMIMHEDVQQGNFEHIEKLKRSNPWKHVGTSPRYT
ncbi:hypothetical protein Taro_038184 [Colocasia esculenta]|uniref:Pre-rRNA-processing protein TSR2 n=1 Tax=Colocasia esculenta TaxID=4460 RepID=A0A843W605_COLES|nr:hypothetical protein [Colocasia esculenta]